VVVLVVARLLPQDMRGLMPIAITWAVLSAPGAMDEAAAVAGRLGGSRFVEAMRAHGFSKRRIYLVHVIGYNLRPVLIRQAAEVFTQVIFLELALSYLTASDNGVNALTHSDSMGSWADILVDGYRWLPPLSMDTGHALVLGLALIAIVLGTARAAIFAGRAR
jgi:ABC-type dipeptide/oligopeptide/nickel transport system permease subunit